MTGFMRPLVDWSGARSAKQRNSHRNRQLPRDGVLSGAKLDHDNSGAKLSLRFSCANPASCASISPSLPASCVARVRGAGISSPDLTCVPVEALSKILVNYLPIATTLNKCGPTAYPIPAGGGPIEIGPAPFRRRSNLR
jgi:hypothetical protein